MVKILSFTILVCLAVSVAANPASYLWALASRYLFPTSAPSKAFILPPQPIANEQLAVIKSDDQILQTLQNAASLLDQIDPWDENTTKSVIDDLMYLVESKPQHVGANLLLGRSLHRAGRLELSSKYLLSALENSAFTNVS